LKEPISNKLSRNAFSIAIGQGVSLIVNFFSIAIAARFLGVIEFGEFGVYLAVVSILSRVIDLGLSPIVFREVSTQKEKISLLSNALSIRLVLYFIILVIYNLVLFFINAGQTAVILSNFLFLSMIISSKFGNFRELLDIPFKADLNMALPMMVVMFENVLLLAGVLIMPYINGGLYYFISVYVLSNVPGFIMILYLLKKKYGYVFHFEVNLYKWLIRESLPLWVYVLLNVLFQQLDIIFLKKLNDSYATGLYTAAFRLSVPLVIIPTALVHTIFPLLLSSDKHRSETIIKFIIKTIFLIPFALAVVFTFKAEPITNLIFGNEYTEAGTASAILLWSQIFLFSSFFVIDLLVAYKKQSWIFIYSLLILTSNVTFNFILIPNYSATGAGLSKLISSIIGFSFTFWVFHKVNLSVNLDKIRIFLWAGIFFLSIYVCSFLPLFLYLFFSALMVFASLLMAGYYESSELSFLFKTINKENWFSKLSAAGVFRK